MRSLNSQRFIRAYKGASQDRLTADWLSSGVDINHELRSQLPILRSRARELEQNNNLARRFLKLCQTHIVGPDGFALQVQAVTNRGEVDSDSNNLVEKDFKRWSRKGVCELTGLYSFVSIQRTTARTTARDGESLLRMYDVRPTARNPWGFVVEMLDPSRLDHRLNDDLRNGNRIRMGIELNAAGRPVAYHLKKSNRYDINISADMHERVDAEDIIHWFTPDRAEQLRAATWMSSAMLSMHQNEAYMDTAIVAARAGAAKMGFIKTDRDVDPSGSIADEDGQLYEELEPGVIGQIGIDDDFIGFDPKYPHEGFGPFIKVNQRGIAAGLEVSYHTLTGDLTDVNFSSIRSGVLEERESWKVLQNSFAESINERIYLRWLAASDLVGRAAKLGLRREGFYERFSEHRWQGRRWSWVDPLKDIKAVIESINAGLTSPQRVASEMGVDINEVLDQIANFQKTMITKNVNLPVYTKQPNVSVEEESDDVANKKG